MDRRKLYALLAVAKKKLNIDEEAYRSILQRHGGKQVGDKISATTMTDKQICNAIEELKSKGFVGSANKKKTKLTTQEYIRVLWNKLIESGKVRSDNKELALQRFVKRQTGIEHLEWIRSYQQANAVITALKVWDKS